MVGVFFFSIYACDASDQLHFYNSAFLWVHVRWCFVLCVDLKSSSIIIPVYNVSFKNLFGLSWVTGWEEGNGDSIKGGGEGRVHCNKIIMSSYVSWSANM